MTLLCWSEYAPVRFNWGSALFITRVRRRRVAHVPPSRTLHLRLLSAEHLRTRKGIAQPMFGRRTRPRPRHDLPEHRQELRRDGAPGRVGAVRQHGLEGLLPPPGRHGPHRHHFRRRPRDERLRRPLDLPRGHVPFRHRHHRVGVVRARHDELLELRYKRAREGENGVPGDARENSSTGERGCGDLSGTEDKEEVGSAELL
mmetsp:Transcript_9472/g.14338  ORF Transcript_9472/g.14338 Transcript_9472/m.14338 type:complete len:201 (+) Transcript_9472:102-704(+)